MRKTSSARKTPHNERSLPDERVTRHPRPMSRSDAGLNSRGLRFGYSNKKWVAQPGHLGAKVNKADINYERSRQPDILMGGID